MIHKMLKYMKYRVMRDLLGYRTFEVKSLDSKPYQDLDFLIKRCIERKKQHKGIPYCPYCNKPMQLRHSTIAGGQGSPYRDDQGWKCIPPLGCCHTAHFGIPLTKAEYQEERKLRGGYTITRPSKRVDERQNKAIRERLKALGYLDF